MGFYGVYFEKDLIRSKLLKILKGTLMDSWKDILRPKPKKTEFIVSNLHSYCFNRYIKEKKNSIEVFFLMAIMALYLYQFF